MNWENKIMESFKKAQPVNELYSDMEESVIEAKTSREDLEEALITISELAEKTIEWGLADWYEHGVALDARGLLYYAVTNIQILVDKLPKEHESE